MNTTLPKFNFPGFFARIAGLSASCLAAVTLFFASPAYTAESPVVSAELAEGAASLRSGGFGTSIAQIEAALKRLDQKDTVGRCDAHLLLAQALQVTGQYRTALEHLTAADQLAKELRDKRRRAAVAGAIGNTYIGLGSTEQASKALDEALVLAREAGADDLTAVFQNNRGNLLISLKKNDDARAVYRESAALAEKSGHASQAASATVNGATAAFRSGNYSESLALLQKTGNFQRTSDGSAAATYTRINSGLLYTDLSRNMPEQAEALANQAYGEFSTALAAAKKSGDLRTESYAYGYMGKLYENDKRFEEALELTRRAQFAAQQVNASEALYRWHWQSGRIHASMGQIDMALASYRHALRYLQAVREELSSCYANPESSYQKTASVVCAELVDLLLQRASQLKPGETQEPFLIEARDTLETLKVFELRDYFRDDCIDAARSVGKKLEAVSGRAAVVYPVFLPNRVELLVSFSGGLKRFTVPVGVDELNKEIRAFRRKLVKRTTGEYLPHAQKLYDWLIRPLEADLDVMKPETLVFVPAGQLRTVPMAALHDGTQFLISKYPIAITPGLSLTDPRPVQRDHARMLSLGLTEARQGFAGLPYVSDELSAIKLLFAGRSLINDQFSLANMEKELKREPFSIVHIATHGQFGGNVDSTFILAFDEKFTMDPFFF